MINRPVIYKSQWDNDAVLSANDCGAASAAMVINYYEGNQALATDTVQTKENAGKGLVTISQMQAAITALGYNSTFRTGLTLQDLKTLLDNDIIPIALVHYGGLTSTQDKQFKGGHFMPVVGYDDGGIWADDPNFKGQYRADGDHHRYENNEFMAAWGGCNPDKNPNFSLLIITRKANIPAQSIFPVNIGLVTVTNDKGANVRNNVSADAQNRNVITVFPKGKQFEVDGFVLGDAVSGNNKWWKMKNSEMYIWTGTTDMIPTLPSTPNIQPAATPAPQPVILSGSSATDLEVENAGLREQLRGIVATATERQLQIEDLQRQLSDKSLELERVKQDVSNIDTFKKVAQSAQADLESYKIINENLKVERDNAYIKAFAGWELTEVPVGTSLIDRFKLMGSVFAIDLKSGYVLGWKIGAKLHKVGEDATSADGSSTTT